MDGWMEDVEVERENGWREGGMSINKGGETMKADVCLLAKG